MDNTKFGLILETKTVREGEKKKKRKRKRRRRGEEEKPRSKGMETNLDYGFYEIWYGFFDFCMEIMDSSMILVHELLGYGLLGFYLDINWVPLSRVLLGRHPNSRVKGSLVEKP